MFTKNNNAESFRFINILWIAEIMTPLLIALSYFTTFPLMLEVYAQVNPSYKPEMAYLAYLIPLIIFGLWVVSSRIIVKRNSAKKAENILRSYGFIAVSSGVLAHIFFIYYPLFDLMR